MSYIKRILQTSTDEPTFIKMFIESLKNDDSRITCSTDIDKQFTDLSGYAEFILNIDGFFIVEFKRESQNSSSANHYNVKIKHNEMVKLEGTVYFCTNGSLMKDDVGKRTWQYVIKCSNKVLHCTFGDCDKNFNFDFCYVNDENIKAVSVSSSSNKRAAESVFTFSDNTQAYLHNRFKYHLTDIDKVEILKNKVFCVSESNGIVKARTDAMFDCSSLSGSQRIVADGTEYIALGDNTIICE